MATIISKEATSLAGANGFYRVEAANLGMTTGTDQLTSTASNTAAFTFANAGNAIGAFVALQQSGGCTCPITVSLETYQSVTSFNTTTERVVKIAHGLSDGDLITFSTTGALPGGLSRGYNYYVVNKTADDFQVSQTLGGAAINLTTGASGTWNVGVAIASKTLTANEITGTAGYVAGHTYAGAGSFMTAFKFTSNPAITTDANKYRISISAGTGTGSWTAHRSAAGSVVYAVWCDTVVSYADNDVVIVDYEVVVDKTTTLGSAAGSGTTILTSAIVCSQPTLATDKQGISMLRWENPPVAAYTLTVPAPIILGTWSGVSIGEEHSATVTISNANPGIVTHGSHGLVDDQMVFLRSTGTLPTGLVQTRGWYYYVEVIDAGSYYLLDAPGGSRIDTTGTQSGVHTLYWGYIPAAQKATLSWTGSVVNNGFQSADANSTQYNCANTILMYGQVPKYQHAILAADANSGQKNIVTTESTDWAGTDIIAVCRSDVAGQGDTALYTVNTVVGTAIAVTANLATYKRKAGGAVIRMAAHGISMLAGAGVLRNSAMGMVANLECKGVYFFNCTMHDINSYVQYQSGVAATARSELVWEDCVVTSDTSSTTTTVFHDAFLGLSGQRFTRVDAFRFTPAGRTYNYKTATVTPGTLTIEYCCVASNNTSNYRFFSSGSTAAEIGLKWIFRHNQIDNPSYRAVDLNGQSCVLEDNDFYGAGFAALYLYKFINPLSVARNRYNKCTLAIDFFAATATSVRDEDSIFGDVVANTVDLSYAVAGLYLPWLFIRPRGAMTVDDADLTGVIPGTRIGFESKNNVAGDDETHYYSGKIQRCNAATADTTVHTAGGSSMRFEPILPGTPFEFEFDIPTGDISTKLMSVAVWCKVNSADYYAGTHQMPRLCVTYDAGATTICADAVQGTTDWQLLQVSFTPTTSAGKIVVTLSGDTDATGTGRYFYFDDFAILYPAGTSLDLSGIDLWQDALPVLPPIATGLSIAGVWTAPSNVSYGADTMGTKLIDAETKADDACALIVSK